ncbi:MAG: hypothetical protein Kow0031_36060 [Anaerolineae bacterium]
MSLDLNLESIILLLFFIAPGFVFTRTYTAYRPRYFRQPSAFEQFVLAIVGSMVIHTAMLALLALGAGIYWLFTGTVTYLLPVSLQNLTSYPLPLLAGFFLVSFLYLAATLVIARRGGTILGLRTAEERPRWWQLLLGADPPEPFLLWHTVLQIEPLRQDLIPPRLMVQMRSGEFFTGDLYQMRLVGDEENTVELALRNVRHRPAGRPDDSLRPFENQILLLKSTDILWISRNE